MTDYLLEQHPVLEKSSFLPLPTYYFSSGFRIAPVVSRQTSGGPGIPRGLLRNSTRSDQFFRPTRCFRLKRDPRPSLGPKPDAHNLYLAAQVRVLRQKKTHILVCLRLVCLLRDSRCGSIIVPVTSGLINNVENKNFRWLINYYINSI